ncbi:hypothetical protein WKR88_03415, partial [Trinickia caryophylli]|uniref:hypothetical protein n=1 Tax=Trinickia caryophylli TaxID=28094 RepID=UPI0030C22E1E
AGSTTCGDLRTCDIKKEAATTPRHRGSLGRQLDHRPSIARHPQANPMESGHNASEAGAESCLSGSPSSRNIPPAKLAHFDFIPCAQSGASGMPNGIRYVLSKFDQSATARIKHLYPVIVKAYARWQ